MKERELLAYGREYLGDILRVSCHLHVYILMDVQLVAFRGLRISIYPKSLEFIDYDAAVYSRMFFWLLDQEISGLHQMYD